MKRKRFSEERIIAILKEHESGLATADLRRKHVTANRERATFGTHTVPLL